ncbi:OmpW family outer membrane protein [Undibacterium sp.]|uniref:OmpW/AlkL family protein n=1 Tax=Undibacterium sp. TaxID=1914977 RepID=UPI0025E1163A|nr:OmpW family outer membrane protein [Undibacterium sp.]
MKLHIQSAVKMLAVAAAMTVAASASAQSAGQWTVKAGLNVITPKVESGDLSAPALPHTKAAVGTDTEPVLIITYSLTDHIVLELPLGLPYEHNLYGAGAIEGTGMLGSSKVLPVTGLVQYRFLSPTATLRPYVGVGATYAVFTKTTGSAQLTALLDVGGPPATFKLDNKLGATLQAGVAVALNEKWFMDLSVTKTYLKTKATFSTGQTQDLKFDPLAVSFGVGYKF